MKKVMGILLILSFVLIIAHGVLAATGWGFYAPSKFLKFTDNIAKSNSFSFYVTLIKFGNKGIFQLFNDINNNKGTFLIDRYMQITGPNLNTTILSLKADKPLGNNLYLSGSLNIGNINLSKDPLASIRLGLSYLYNQNTKFTLNYEQSEDSKNVSVKIYIEF